MTFGRVASGATPAATIPRYGIGLCKAQVRWCKCSVPIESVLEIRNAFLNLRSLPLSQDEPAFQIALVNFRRNETRRGKPLVFLAGDRYFDFFGDGLGQLALQGERIAHFPVIGLGPEMRVGCSRESAAP